MTKELNQLENVQDIRKRVEKVPYYLLIFLNIAAIIAFFVILMIMLFININLTKEVVVLERENIEYVKDLVVGVETVLEKLN